ncbi:hypothetical protein ElyMa_006853600 [Elysia marginata]|uniref:MADF domain-containing protein n=1 Tax=Elysia marginata TaxID=1093978 RepID=A0AAV4J8I4_9GAST|nr:hypothetical protein ElyMa_006853600 [Elysia marginata]
MTCWNKEFLLEFINMYREEECLWKVKSPSYYDKQKREKSYRRLLFKVREINPKAQRQDITKKIKNLRTVFRKENRQWKDSLRPGAGLVYSPRLWYYKDLEFLTDQEECGSTEFNLSQEQNTDLQSDSVYPVDLYGAKNHNNNDVEDSLPNNFVIKTSPDHDGSTLQSDDESTGPLAEPAQVHGPRTREIPYHSSRTSPDLDGSTLHSDESTGPSAEPVKLPGSRTRETPSHSQARPFYVDRCSKEPHDRNNKRKAPDDEILQLARGTLKNISQMDKFDSFGQFVTQSLREMSREQYVHVQKLISDVIYEGNMATLSRHSRVLAAPEDSPSAEF